MKEPRIVRDDFEFEDLDDDEEELLPPELQALADSSEGDEDFEELHQEDEEELDELSKEFVLQLIDKVMDFMVLLVGHDLHPYQKPLSRRIIESVIINDGE